MAVNTETSSIERNLTDLNANGTLIGQTAADKIAFHGGTPIIQRSGADQAAVTTVASTTSTPYGFVSADQADGIITLLNEIRAALVAVGLIKGSA